MPLRRALSLRQLLAVILLPGTATVIIPVWLHRSGIDPVPLPPWARLVLGTAGALLLLTGAALAGTSVGLFTRIGEGTLAPWDPTRKLVVRGAYRYVRNPMISGVAAVLLGEAALLGSAAQLAWFLAFAAANALWIPLVEEPGLERRFGDEWREYRRHVPRWIPRWSPWVPVPPRRP
jgi:protein-S-isoprenylcysteine O-methyltransferase Ste14